MQSHNEHIWMSVVASNTVSPCAFNCGCDEGTFSRDSYVIDRLIKIQSISISVM